MQLDSIRRRRQALKDRSRGFTLMEMLLVLAILVLLMALVGPRILGTQRKSDISATKTQIGMLKAALERYALDLKTFPSTEDGLPALIEPPAKGEGESRWDGPYVDADAIPADPWGHPYQYEYPPSHGKRNFPDIWSWGPDGEDGTEDDVTNWTSASEGREGSAKPAGNRK